MWKCGNVELTRVCQLFKCGKLLPKLWKTFFHKVSHIVFHTNCGNVEKMWITCGNIDK